MKIFGLKFFIPKVCTLTIHHPTKFHMSKSTTVELHLSGRW